MRTPSERVGKAEGFDTGERHKNCQAVRLETPKTFVIHQIFKVLFEDKNLALVMADRHQLGDGFFCEVF